MTAGPTTCEKGQFSLNKYKSMVEGSLDISDFILDIKLTIIWKGDGIKIQCVLNVVTLYSTALKTSSVRLICKLRQ